MELKEIKGITKATIKKLKESGYETIESLREAQLDEKTLQDLGFTEKEIKIISEFLEPKKKVNEGLLELKNENKYLIAGFKVSKHYNKDLKGKQLEDAFEKFKKEK
jgi:hypothetical protein